MPRPAHKTLYPRLVRIWTDDPDDPGRLLLSTPSVQYLAAAIAPGTRLTDLGGTYSLNVRLDPADLVLRVHLPPACASRPRLLALQEVRRRLASQGLHVPVALSWHGTTVFRCGSRWAELEKYLPNERLPPTLESHLWLFGAMGALHQELAPLDLATPHPVGATYAPPGSVRRWLRVTEAAVRGDPEAEDTARLVGDLARRVRRRWIPAADLPVQLVHGDVRLSNVRRTPTGDRKSVV